MLVATPLQLERNKPRVISEIKKVTPKSSLDHLQPRISGELFFYNGSTDTWCRRHVQIRGGVLLVSAGLYNGVIGFRVALRHLNLRPGSEPRTFALFSRGCDIEPIATFQAATQREYDIWVKIISIELMRQTPLDAIKYLDIMGLAPSPSESNIFNTSSSTRSRRSSSSDRSSCSSGSTDSIVTSPTLTQRRCRSELRLNLTHSFKEDMHKAKDLVQQTTCLSSTSCDSSTSSEEDFNSNKQTTCVDCENKRNAKKSLFQEDTNYFSYSDFQRQQARERIRRVLSLKQQVEKPKVEKPGAIILKKYDIGSSLGYSRVYNVREGIQLKSYDIKNIKPVERVCSKKESTKLDMLRKNTNQLAEKKDLNFIITDYKSTRPTTCESIPPPLPPPKSEASQEPQSDEETVEQLLQKCQNSDSYVPVKDKLVLFESLCRLGRRLAKSSEDLVSIPNNVTHHKRARSMHDLNTNYGVGVREICKYFEMRRSQQGLEDNNNSEGYVDANLQNKYNTIAKGYRKVMRASKDSSFNMKNGLRKDYKSPFLHDQKNYYFGFKQFRDGNRIISYV